MIELINVSKGYTLKKVHKAILLNVSFRFPEHRNVAIVGRNGVGKSTLMRLLAGTELPDRGYVYRRANVSWPLGFGGAFNGSMTGLENARFVARVYGKDTEEVIEYVKDFSELGPSLRLPIRTYSSGMKARLAFGLSMAVDFDYYLIDEITAVGDESFKKKSKEVFHSKLSRSHVIMASHSMATLKAYCDCGLLLSKNGIFFYSDIDDLTKEYATRCG